MNPLSIGIVSDEITPDFREALAYAHAWGIALFEIRCLAGGRVPFISEEELTELRTAVDSGANPHHGSFSGHLQRLGFRPDTLEFELSEILPKTIRMAKDLCCAMVITFGFKRSGFSEEEEFAAAVESMSRAARIAKEEHVVLAVENEPGFVCDTGTNTAALLRAVGSPFLRANWDPANAFGGGEAPYPDGYEAVKPFHRKRPREGHAGSVRSSNVCPVGEGLLDWKSSFARSCGMAVVSHVTIETHCLPLIEKIENKISTFFRNIFQK